MRAKLKSYFPISKYFWQVLFAVTLESHCEHKTINLEKILLDIRFQSLQQKKAELRNSFKVLKYKPQLTTSSTYPVFSAFFSNSSISSKDFNGKHPFEIEAYFFSFLNRFSTVSQPLPADILFLM